MLTLPRRDSLIKSVLSDVLTEEFLLRCIFLVTNQSTERERDRETESETQRQTLTETERKQKEEEILESLGNMVPQIWHAGAFL